MAVKRKFLVVYDYGQGGMWMFFYAHLPSDITAKYPELKVIDQIPSWMDETAVDRIERNRTYDIDQPPHGWLRNLRPRSRDSDA